MIKNSLRFAAFALFLASPLLKAAIPPAENLLPADTLLFFTVPDCAAARVSAKSAPNWMFWNDPAMKPFRDRFIGKWDDQFITPIERDLGLNTSDFMDLPQGQFTLAMTVNGANGHETVPPGYLLLLDARGKSDMLKTNLAALVRKWNKAGRALRTEQFHGLVFTVVPLTSNDFAGVLPKKPQVSEIGKEPEKPQKPGEIYFTQFESLLVAGNSPKVVEPVAAHLTGGGVPSIADNSVFAADKLSQFRDNPQYYGWLNGKGFIDLFTQAPPADADEDSPSLMASMSTSKVLAAVGLTGIKSISFAMHEAHDGSLLTVHMSAPEGTRTGLLKILALTPKDAGVPPFVPADAVKFSRFRLDGKQTWAELQKIVGDISPQSMAGLNSLINMANAMGSKTPGFDIRNDLFGNLNDDIISYQKPVAGNSLAELNEAPTIYLVAVSNPDAVINALRVFGGIGGQDSSAAPREFQGRKIYSLPLKSAPGAPGSAPQPRALHVSSGGGYIALSTDEAIVEEFLRSSGGQNKPLRDNPGLMSAMAHLGGAGGGVFGYENQRETMRITFKALKNSIAADTALKLFPPTFREWMDFSLLPDYEAVSKYFYLSTYAGNANAEGLTFKAFAPRPPQLN